MPISDKNLKIIQPYSIRRDDLLLRSAISKAFSSDEKNTHFGIVYCCELLKTTNRHNTPASSVSQGLDYTELYYCKIWVQGSFYTRPSPKDINYQNQINELPGAFFDKELSPGTEVKVENTENGIVIISSLKSKYTANDPFKEASQAMSLSDDFNKTDCVASMSVSETIDTSGLSEDDLELLKVPETGSSVDKYIFGKKISDLEIVSTVNSSSEVKCLEQLTAEASASSIEVDNINNSSKRYEIGYNNGQPFEIAVLEIEELSRNRKKILYPEWIVKDLTAMAKACNIATGKKLKINSAFRTKNMQRRLNLRMGKQSAVTGYSKHQSGEAIDISVGMGGTMSSAWNTYKNAGRKGSVIFEWLKKNAYKYGFIWPSWAQKRKSFEPWHWEYQRAPIQSEVLVSMVDQ